MSDYFGNDDNHLKKDFHTESSTCKQLKPYKLSNLPTNILDWIEEHGFDLVIICDVLGRVLYVSRSVNHMLGYDSDTLLGKQMLSYLPQNDQQLIKEWCQNTPNKSKKFTVSIRDVFGKYVWVESTIASIRDEETNCQLFISLYKDITDKREAEEMLIRSEKMSVAGQLAAGVAHEIRNPLTSLKGFVQLLQAGTTKKDEYYKIMIDEIDKINNITSELLFISKPMTDEKNWEKILAMINDVVTLFQSQARLYNIDLVVKSSEDREIYCDKTQIKQVLINLLKNAVEEMLDGGTIVVEVDYNDSLCIVSIIDEGPGIPEHIIHKLKEPFFTTKKDGTGLGLMISNKIVENHQGKIDIVRNKKKGSTFRITIPIAPS
ncbi:ATP-binding protein [Aquibacillus albus]|uniref:histidine kinase n=1 Tax=Aquibacillus albus TaxID=1168171 RepID=A0ABS2N208_9BACI|nr:ATP-binding protein [Aquibacillus albus]MBM7572131.1 two-component system sporulation sensor kinase A [Aquibacillus albus]